MTPLSNHQTRQEHSYNHHARARSMVEHTVGVLTMWKTLCQCQLCAQGTTLTLMWCFVSITNANYKQSAGCLQLTIKWDSSFNTTGLEQIWMVRTFVASGVEFSYFLSWQKRNRTFKRMLLYEAQWEVWQHCWCLFKKTVLVIAYRKSDWKNLPCEDICRLSS